MRFGVCIWEFLNILVVTQLPNPSINPQNFLMAVAKSPLPIPPPIHFNLTACKVMIYTWVRHLHTQPHFKLALPGGEGKIGGEKSFCSACFMLCFDRPAGAKGAENHAKAYYEYFSVFHCGFFVLRNWARSILRQHAEKYITAGKCMSP